MTAKYFVDTNVLVYAVAEDEKLKRTRAREVLSDCVEKGSAVISSQILQEFYSVSTNKMGLDALHARDLTQRWTSMETVSMGPADVLAAIDVSILNCLSIWDSLVVTAAAKSNCEVLLTEDLNHGQVINGVRIENPFRDIGKPPKRATRERRARYRTTHRKKK